MSNNDSFFCNNFLRLFIKNFIGNFFKFAIPKAEITAHQKKRIFQRTDSIDQFQFQCLFRSIKTAIRQLFHIFQRNFILDSMVIGCSLFIRQINFVINPIRRISLFYIEKNRKDIAEIEGSIEACNYKLEHIVDYAEEYLTELEGMIDKEEFQRKTKLSEIEILTAKDVAVRNMDLRYDADTGYLGTAVRTGEPLLKISTFDKVFVMKNNGEFRVVSATDKVFIGRGGIYYINYAEKDVISKEIFTVIYKDKIRDKNVFMIKRFQIPSWTVDKTYSVVPNEKAAVKKISMHPSAHIAVCLCSSTDRIEVS